MDLLSFFKKPAAGWPQAASQVSPPVSPVADGCARAVATAERRSLGPTSKRARTDQLASSCGGEEEEQPAPRLRGECAAGTSESAQCRSATTATTGAPAGLTARGASVSAGCSSSHGSSDGAADTLPEYLQPLRGACNAILWGECGRRVV